MSKRIPIERLREISMAGRRRQRDATARAEGRVQQQRSDSAELLRLHLSPISFEDSDVQC